MTQQRQSRFSPFAGDLRSSNALRKAPFPGALKFRLPPATFIRPAQRPAGSIHQPGKELARMSSL